MRYLPLCLLAVFIAGCHETTVPLGTAQQSHMDSAFVGDWRGTDESIIIRNLDDHHYYVEYDNGNAAAGEKTIRMVGDLYSIDTALFAQLRQLTRDGSIEPKHLILRVSLKDDQLSLRQLNDDFFKKQQAATTAQLRKVLADNLNNPDLYDGEPALFQSAKPPATSTAQ